MSNCNQRGFTSDDLKKIREAIYDYRINNKGQEPKFIVLPIYENLYGIPIVTDAGLKEGEFKLTN